MAFDGLRQVLQKNTLDHFLIRSTLRSLGVKKFKFSQKWIMFSEGRNYPNTYASQHDRKIAKW